MGGGQRRRLETVAKAWPAGGGVGRQQHQQGQAGLEAPGVAHHCKVCLGPVHLNAPFPLLPLLKRISGAAAGAEQYVLLFERYRLRYAEAKVAAFNSIRHSFIKVGSTVPRYCVYCPGLQYCGTVWPAYGLCTHGSQGPRGGGAFKRLEAAQSEACALPTTLKGAAAYRRCKACSGAPIAPPAPNAPPPPPLLAGPAQEEGVRLRLEAELARDFEEFEQEILGPAGAAAAAVPTNTSAPVSLSARLSSWRAVGDAAWAALGAGEHRATIHKFKAWAASTGGWAAGEGAAALARWAAAARVVAGRLAREGLQQARELYFLGGFYFDAFMLAGGAYSNAFVAVAATAVVHFLLRTLAKRLRHRHAD